MKTRKFFGTDGIRGTANQFPMLASIALNVGMAAGTYFQRGNHRHRVVIAKDTRLSGYMIENALTSGFLAAGMDVILVGPMPTPAVAMLTKSMRADMGVMISASHNPYRDNGIKLFGPDGFKLSDKAELAIEAMLENPSKIECVAPEKIGRAKRIEDARGRYIEFAKASFPDNLDLSNMRIVLDCANGASYQVAPTVLQELGAEVIAIGVNPNGLNVNEGCGSNHPALLQQTVHERRADIGISLDGDADRLVLCDEHGQLVDGDQILAMVAYQWHRGGKLKNNKIIATQMSNMGMEHFLTENGMELIRTKVGDRYVVEAMRETGSNLGGEQSGHVVMSDYATTGDGLIAALQVLAAMQQYGKGKPASEMLQVFTPMPQLLRNIRYGAHNPLGDAPVTKAIADAEKKLGKNGRIFIRKSGTEPLIRVMIEGKDVKEIGKLADGLEAVIKAAL